MLEELKDIVDRYRIARLRKQGLRIADDCRLIGFPSFGSEPYLISIGSHVTITSEVTFITHDGATWVFRDMTKYENVIRFGRITIRDNCFIGYRSTIMPGVCIGPNAIVGAGSLVINDVPANSVAAGVPARVVSTLEEYAKKCSESMPEYDVLAYKKNKKEELLRLFPGQRFGEEA